MAEESTRQSAPERSESAVSEPSARPSGPRPGGPRPGGPRPGGRGGRDGGRKFFRRKKVCKFCTAKIDSINYKDVRLLSQFVAESGKIEGERRGRALRVGQRVEDGQAHVCDGNLSEDGAIDKFDERMHGGLRVYGDADF